MKRGVRLPSARVIAIGRYMLATLFLLVIWLNDQPAPGAPTATFLMLGAYFAFSLSVLWLTWNDWWRDAKLAGPVHAIDIIVFTLLALMSGGYRTPYFTFFMFLLLAAAIRWGWRATALTAILLILLYLSAGIVAAESAGGAELHQFAIRTGHLIILSLILIWFGVNQWRASAYARGSRFSAEPVIDQSPLETSLTAAVDRLQASVGVFVWRDDSELDGRAFVQRNRELTVIGVPEPALQNASEGSFLYDLRKDRALARDERQNLRSFSARSLIQPGSSAAPLNLREGLAIPIQTGAGEGELFLEGMPDLSTDHIAVGSEIALDVAAHIERHALMLAVEESAEARSRLNLARDLHDSVVQFLAGAAFRLEAMRRDHASGRDLAPELNHLKQLMLEEQGELRSFIAALRSAPQIAVSELADDLKALSVRLAKQWDILCAFSAQASDVQVPTRLQLDAQHLTREAVANAVRHAGAKNIEIRLRVEPAELLLDFINDGSRYPNSPLTGQLPRSLSERVKLAGGALELTRGMGVTKIAISLPIGGKLQ